MKKARWSGSLTIRRLPTDHPKNWVIAAPLAVTIDDIKPGWVTTMRILPGLFTDGASNGRLFYTLIGCPFNGKYTPAAVMHDGLYASHVISRKSADRVFRVLMLSLDVSTWRAYAMYAAVRTFGKLAWDGHDAEENARVAKLVTCKTYKDTL